MDENSILKEKDLQYLHNIDREYLINYYEEVLVTQESTEFHKNDITQEIHELHKKLIYDEDLEIQIVIIALYYLDHKIKLKPVKVGKSLINLMASIILSTKFLMDEPWENLDWASLYGIPLERLNRYEINFLKLLRYKLSLGDSFVLFLQRFMKKLNLIKGNNFGINQKIETFNFFEKNTQKKKIVKKKLQFVRKLFGKFKKLMKWVVVIINYFQNFQFKRQNKKFQNKLFKKITI
ncbi:hypothetical protein M0812_27894 [Anaeramoeba flamelloides]|uniref:Cyclin N-terminal domain-containing protein n=1 Tax=Anaeramoeba flamelloides TaxID=1746091 RepID=A0AAV7YD94_9EUKA|nr:hypothetical protein M0812_27894 [Anaeramoeba flamelloides]